MGLSEIHSQIITVQEGVSGVGNVHDYERWSGTWEKFLEHFKTVSNKINGCIIRREKTPQRRSTMGERELAHIFVFKHLYGLKDEDGTEKIFQAYLEACREAFDVEAMKAEPLNGECLTLNPDWGPMSGAEGLQIETVENRMFGKVLCHYAECRLCAIETVSD